MKSEWIIFDGDEYVGNALQPDLDGVGYASGACHLMVWASPLDILVTPKS